MECVEIASDMTSDMNLTSLKTYHLQASQLRIPFRKYIYWHNPWKAEVAGKVIVYPADAKQSLSQDPA